MQLSPRLPWYALLAAVILVPLAVGVVPLAGTPWTLNVFVQAKLIVLAATIGLTLAAWALLVLRRGTLFMGRALIPLGAFVLAVGLSATVAIDRRLAVFGDFEQGVGLLVIILCSLACFLTTQLVRNENRLATLTSATVLTATAVAAIGLLQQVAGFDVLGIGRGLSLGWILQRGYGTIGNPDTYAAYLVLPAMLALHRLRVTTLSERWKWGAAVVVVVSSLVMSQTRGPLLALAAGIVGYVLWERRARRGSRQAKRPRKTPATSTSSRVVIAVAAVAILLGTVAATVLATESHLAERFSFESLASLGGRVPLWNSALRIASAHPLLGIGPDSFRLGWYSVRQVAHLAGGVGLVITDPHSVPLLVLATMGVIGLFAAAYLVIATLATGFKCASRARSTRGSGSDYDAWVWGTLALSVGLLSSMLTSVLLFMLLVGFGVLIAPALQRADVPRQRRASVIALSALSLVIAAGLLLFSAVTASAQAVAVGARTNDADLARTRAVRAASIAPWDTEIRNLKYETMVQAALDNVFTGKQAASQRVAETSAALRGAAENEPDEYLFPYRQAMLLIGAGQKLGASYTREGVEAGLAGLRIYPNSLELRTGVASGYLTLDQPAKAERLLDGLWRADAAYEQAGLTYAEALIAQGKDSQARAVLADLKRRFPTDQSIPDLESRVSSQ